MASKTLVEPVMVVVSTQIAFHAEEAHRAEKSPSLAAVVGVNLLVGLDTLRELAAVHEEFALRGEIELAGGAAVQRLVAQLSAPSTGTPARPAQRTGVPSKLSRKNHVVLHDMRPPI